MELLPDPPDGSERMTLRRALRWARDSAAGSLYSDFVFAVVPTASAIDAARARINAGGAVTPDDGLIANTNTSREDVAMWFIQEAMRLTG